MTINFAVLSPQRRPRHEFVADAEYEVMPSGAPRTCLLDPAEADPSPADACDPSWESGPRETVLLVEDDRHVRGLMRMILHDRGYRVLAAQDGEEALVLAQSYPAPVDLLLTDVVLPRLDGRQLAERLSQVHPEARVLYFSGYAEHTLFRDRAPGQRENFLQKPFSAARLVLRVRELLDRAGSKERDALPPGGRD